MILQCPACSTRYVVPDSAIGVEGRTVRCAACRHSWFQEPSDTLVQAAQAPVAADEAVVPVADPISDQVAQEEAGGALSQPITQPVFPAPRRRRRRRNPARLWTIAAAAAAVVMLLGVAALSWFGSPGSLAALGLPVGSTGSSLVIDLPREPERRALASGNELFALTGRVTNPTDTAQRVPDIVAELRDRQGRVIYGWTITPPVRTLGPGANAEFGSAKVDVPAGAEELSLTFAGDPTT